jgi:predicted RecA/RadA family phage recombinase
MAKGHVDPGKTMTYTNATAAAIEIGAVVVVGDIVGIALDSIPVGESKELAICEQWEIPKEAALAISQGEKVYFDAANKVANLTNANPYAGIAMLSAAATDNTVCVLINGR